MTITLLRLVEIESLAVVFALGLPVTGVLNCEAMQRITSTIAKVLRDVEITSQSILNRSVLD